MFQRVKKVVSYGLVRWISTRVNPNWTFLESQFESVVFLLPGIHWFQNYFRNWYWPILKWCCTFFGQKIRRGDPSYKKNFFWLFGVSLVSNRPAGWADSKTVSYIVVLCLYAKILAKKCQKMQKMAKNG